MITSLLLIIGFFTTGDTFGASLIGAFSLAQYWLWFLAILASIIAIFVLGITTIGGTAYVSEQVSSKFFRFAGFLGSSIIGTLLSFMVVIFNYVRLWLSYYIIDNVNASATSFSEIGQDAQYGVYAFLFTFVISFLISFKRKQNKDY